ncbi:hypothetical protein QBC46DRAFT_378548 [Diplogelasinospora grovesii]|uniref:Uncharacterized protein n=1 Tax=Diplogelasinospora grovesii TaxID=303347 RepID=A0AAN6S7S1_9PEZI|nr:hypothetical protein QBC46DRAFT_378548 [Diplogelasinospora grovesii]
MRVPGSHLLVSMMQTAWTMPIVAEQHQRSRMWEVASRITGPICMMMGSSGNPIPRCFLSMLLAIILASRYRAERAVHDPICSRQRASHRCFAYSFLQMRSCAAVHTKPVHMCPRLTK